MLTLPKANQSWTLCNRNSFLPGLKRTYRKHTFPFLDTLDLATYVLKKAGLANAMYVQPKYAMNVGTSPQRFVCNAMTTLNANNGNVLNRSLKNVYMTKRKLLNYRYSR